MKTIEKLVVGAVLLGSLLTGCYKDSDIIGEGMEPYYKYVRPYLKKEGHTRPEDQLNETSKYMRNAYPDK